MTSSILILDLETENHVHYGKKASPYCPDNYVVESGWRLDRVLDDGDFRQGTIGYKKFNSKEEFLNSTVSDWLPIPDDCWLIVAHNAAYEISWFLQYARATFEDFIRRGGRIWCTMHGEYLATDQLSTYPSLEETAVKYGGTKKVDGIKLLWQQGYLTSQIDPALLHKYLVDEVEGDVANTALVFYAQYDELEKQGKFPLVWTRMDALLAFAYCEWFGMYVNMPIAMKNLELQKQQVKELEDKLRSYLPKDLPEEFEFSFGSNQQMSALLFGGAVKYIAREYYDPPKYEKVNAVFDTELKEYILYLPFEFPDEYTKEKYQRYKSGKNKGQLKIERIDSDVQKKHNVDKIYTFKPIVEIDKLPDIIKSKFSNGRRKGDWVTELSLADGSPVYSTGSEVMEILAAHGYEFCNDLVTLTALNKDIGTYYLQEVHRKDGSLKEVKGMLQFVVPDREDGSGIIHHSLNTCATITARLSSSRPNLQNIPTKKKSKVKEMFTSRFGTNGRIVEIDYRAIEVVISCCHSGDLKLLDLLNKETDMHCYRLASMENVPYETVLTYCKDKTVPEYSAWDAKRSDIKKPSFALQYGASADGMAYRTGLPLEYCQKFIEVEYKEFPDTYSFRKVIRDEVEETAKVPNMVFREYSDDGTFKIFRRGYWRSPTGMRYMFRQYDTWVKDPSNPKRMKQVIDFKDTELANYWCQGEAFFVVVVAFALIIRYLIKNNFFDGQVALITNVHDAAYFDFANEEIAVKVGLEIKDIMENGVKKYILSNWSNYGHLRDIEFPTSAEMGVDMLNKDSIKEAA